MTKKPTIVGQRVQYRFSGVDFKGEIVGKRGKYLRVRFDTHKHISLINPKWNIKYLDKDE